MSRDYWVFWTGQGISRFGDEITLVALPWLVFTQTHSTVANGALEAMAYLPAVLFGLALGAFADRWPRRRSMVWADLARVALLGTIPAVALLGFGLSLGQLLAVAFAAGLCKVLFDASAQAFVADLVTERTIVRANARLALTDSLAVVVGPSVAGVLIATIGASRTIAVDAATFIASAAALILVRVRRDRRAAVPASLRTSILEGLRFIRGQRIVLVSVWLLGGANMMAGVLGTLMIPFMQSTLHYPSWKVGVVIAMNGAGAVLGSLVVGRISGRLGMARGTIAGIGTAAAGVVLASSATRASFGVLLAGMFLIGMGVIGLNILNTAVRQHIVPGELLGRVSASFRAVVRGAIPVGALGSGFLAAAIGIRPTLVACAACYVALTAASLASPLREPDASLGLATG